MRPPCASRTMPLVSCHFPWLRSLAGATMYPSDLLSKAVNHSCLYGCLRCLETRCLMRTRPHGPIQEAKSRLSHPPLPSQTRTRTHAHAHTSMYKTDLRPRKLTTQHRRLGRALARQWAALRKDAMASYSSLHDLRSNSEIAVPLMVRVRMYACMCARLWRSLLCL